MNTKEKSVPTDEEINEMMDFDGLMKEYAKSILKSNPPVSASWLKWGIGTSTVIAISISIYFYFKMENTTITNEPIIYRESNETPASKISDSVSNTLKQSSETLPIPNIASKKSSEEVKPEIEPVAITQEYLAAEPIQGFPSLYEYFDRELNYPAEATKDSVQGVESVAFVIDKKGNPTKIEILHSLGSSFDKEVLRILENMPLWKPATLNGQPVASKVSLPFSFRIKAVKQ
jgi:TonB family protein